MTTRLYDLELSGNCYKARLFLNILGADHELVPVDLMGGEHKSEAYLKINPKGQVPTLKDGDLVLSDSQAILVYLANKHNATDWYPTDAESQAQIQYWLSTAANEVARGPADARLVKLFGAELDYDKAKGAANHVLGLLNDHLGSQKWLVGDRPTVADIAVFPYVALSGDGNIDLGAYPHITRWIQDFKQVEGFIPMPGIAA